MKGKPITDKAWAKFLEELATSGIISQACKKARICRTSAYARRKEDEAFAQAWAEAEELGVDAMEDEALRRGKDGTLKPVYQQGRKVGTVREYSDTLLIFMLKAKRPDKFKERVAAEHTGKNGGPIKSDTTVTTIDPAALKAARDGILGEF